MICASALFFVFFLFMSKTILNFAAETKTISLMKKTLLFLMSAICCMSVLAYDIEVDGLYYYIDRDNMTASFARSLEHPYQMDSLFVPAQITYDGETYAVTSIYDQAVYGNENLVFASIPEGVTSLEQYVFYGCVNLNEVQLPESLERIAEYTFYNCYALSDITLPSNLASIGSSAFFCAGFEHINIPAAMTVIEPETFSGCSRLKEIVIPENIKEINSAAFSACTSLAKITFNADSCAIGYAIFASCTNCKKVEIGGNVTLLMSKAFANMTALDTLTVLAMTPPECQENVFYNYNPVLVVPAGTADLYRNADTWMNFSQIEEAEPTAVENAMEERINLWMKGSRLINPDGIRVIVVSADGRIVAEGEEDIEMSGMANGIYFVTDGQRSVKVALKI